MEETATQWGAASVPVGEPATPPAEPMQVASYECDICNKSFTRPQGLGAHKRQVHGIRGSSGRSESRRLVEDGIVKMQNPADMTKGYKPQQRPKKQSIAAREGLDTDRLLKDLFPSGIPATQEALEGVSEWLAQAEELARLR